MHTGQRENTPSGVTRLYFQRERNKFFFNRVADYGSDRQISANRVHGHRIINARARKTKLLVSQRRFHFQSAIALLFPRLNKLNVIGSRRDRKTWFDAFDSSPFLITRRYSTFRLYFRKPYCLANTRRPYANSIMRPPYKLDCQRIGISNANVNIYAQ